MNRTLYPVVHLYNNSVSAFVFAGAEVVARPFSRRIFKPKITNWRLPDQTSAPAGEFNFVDGADFDFVDGTDFDFVG